MILEPQSARSSNPRTLFDEFVTRLDVGLFR